MANKEYVCMEETPAVTQKLIRTWVSTGYTVDIIHQQALLRNESIIMITSLWRIK